MLLDYGRNLAYPEKAQADTGRTGTGELHTERPWMGIEPGNFLL